MNLTAETASKVATQVFMKDLRLRKGFGELIDSISDWHDIEAFMQSKVEQALNAASAPAEKQQDISF